VLEALGDGGRARNLTTIIARTHLARETVATACKELADAGFAKVEGKRVRRTGGSAEGEGRLSKSAQALLDALPADGSLRSNLRLRSEVDLDDDAYAGAKQELIDAGVVQLGRGRGGRLGRREVEGSKAAEDERPRVGKESELYEPFARWVGASLSGGGLRFSSVRVTGSPKGRKRSSGKWSRPDVTAVTVANFEYLPGATVEVLSYEIKRAADADKLESVYEAAAHGRWTHRASLAVETLPGESPVPDAVADEAERFGLGLYSMVRREQGSWEIREVREPDFRGPEAENLDQLLREYFQTDHDERQQYLTSLR